MGSRKIGKYQILERVATGTQGTVDRAFDPESGKQVAVKVLRPSLISDDSFVDRFRREARIAAGFDHRNVVRIYDAGQDGDKHFISMEFLPETLHQMARRTDFSMSQVIALAIGMADGLGAIHNAGIVHRDMKPQNVLIAPDGTPKISDFGIARDGAYATITQAGAMMGTPHYMSPEQANGVTADARSDVYALGCMIYQLLTGQVPFKADSPIAVLRKHVELKARPAAELNSEVSVKFSKIIEKAMSKEPGQRFADGQEFARALRSVSRRKSVSNIPVSGPNSQQGTSSRSDTGIAGPNRGGERNNPEGKRSPPGSGISQPSSPNRWIVLLVLSILIIAAVPTSYKMATDAWPDIFGPTDTASNDGSLVDKNRQRIMTFVVDTSDSMVGDHLLQTRTGLKNAVSSMSSTSSFGLLSYNDTAQIELDISRNPASRQAEIFAAIDAMQTGGRTALYDAIKAAVRMTDSAIGDTDAIRVVVVITDGEANTGSTRLDEIIRMESREGTTINDFSGMSREVRVRDETGRTVEKADIVGTALELETNQHIQIFYVGIGEDADTNVGRMLADATAGGYQIVSTDDLTKFIESLVQRF